VKPQTFMNLSGAVLKPWLRRPFWAAANDLLVVSDEVQLPVGAYRFRAKGSAGGHNGLKSIEAALKSQDYPAPAHRRGAERPATAHRRPRGLCAG
jgi:PTH1 family peptidyl-tRNA hydrolase